MNENEFRDAYKRSQERIALTEDQKRTIAETASAPHVRAAETDGGARAGAAKAAARAAAQADTRSRRSTASGKNGSGAPRPSVHAGSSNPSKRRSPLGRFALPAAACLVVAALAVGLAAFSSSGGLLGPGNATPDFAVQAYAADRDSILEMGTDNQIIFSRNADMTLAGSKEDYLHSEGCYTGCLFRVEGEDITRIQASVSTGMLYRQTTETVTAGEDPERLSELAGWKPTARGLGEYYSGYDEVSIIGSPDSLAKDDPDKQWLVSLTKKLGSTIDVPVTDDDEYSFGFWTNEDYGDAEGMNAFDVIIDLFDGATLTITATFADGHTTTQVIELHAADVKASFGQDENGFYQIELTPEIVDPAGLEQYADYVHPLYGTVKSTSHEPFPGSLENANEFENVVSEPLGFERQPVLRPLGDDAVIDEKNIRSASESMPFSLDAGTSFSLSDVRMLERSTALPDGLTLGDLRTDMQSWEYFNRVVSQIDGYTIDENGTIAAQSEGFSWVVMEGTVENTGDTATELTGDGGFYGEYAVITDDEGHVSTALFRSFALVNGEGWSGLAPGRYRDFTLEPGESATVRWLAIVPDAALDDPSLFLLGGAFDDPDDIVLEGLKLELPA
ncbi:hypothetical protein [Raoultibacter phocaeensis]|uniref:hypothetical protein n=1 Tax=Raoultibacter phocaeensis TaxID=2479841 RepID=UPI00111BAAE2|nr:hypothetical protein [Raoultibacter phocaeensis]